MLKNWPYLPSGANATFHNLLPACTSRAVNPVGEDLWLGTDPLLEDSDRYLWDGFSIRPLYPSFGDGIPDGWEVHFGLNPLNRSNALEDPDGDGWDTNRDGGISSDVSRTLTALKVGEALSTLEEYLVHFDDGNTVYLASSRRLLAMRVALRRCRWSTMHPRTPWPSCTTMSRRSPNMTAFCTP